VPNGAGHCLAQADKVPTQAGSWVAERRSLVFIGYPAPTLLNKRQQATPFKKSRDAGILTKNRKGNCLSWRRA
ncbi:MAG: hypothetical protein ACRD72_08710, partial [Candidatus Angelobacter sp.]